MRRILLAALALLVPVAAQAIQLRWASGSSTLTFSQSIQCTLIVQAESPDVTLPGQWHLLWTARDCGDISAIVETQFVDTVYARMAEAGASSPAEAAAHVSTAYFRSDAMGFVPTARYILTLPAGSSGKFQVVASSGGDGDPEVLPLLKSGIVTFNGGTTSPLPPVIVHASSDHRSNQLTLEVQGAGLSQSASAVLVAPDNSWSVPLEIDSATDSTLSATAELPTSPSVGILQLTVQGGSTGGSTVVSACTISEVTASQFFNYRLFFDPQQDPTGPVSTKDFALHRNFSKTTHRGLFHLMYIRHRDKGSGNKEPSLGHAWSTDMKNWKVDTTGTSAFFPGPSGSWDRSNVWAPSIVAHGDSTYMFYTGVGPAPNSDQSIGYTATANFDTCNTEWSWRKQVVTVDSLPWANTTRPFPDEGQQCRDPYVFPHPDPDSSGRFFMVFTAMDQAHQASNGFVVGLARNKTAGSLERWISLGYYRSTDRTRTGLAKIEGPIVFADRGSPAVWWLVFTEPQGDCTGGSLPPEPIETLRFERQTSAGSAPWDTTRSLWLADGAEPDTMFRYLMRAVPGQSNPHGHPDSTTWGWQGIEYLRDPDMLAGFTSYGEPRPPLCGLGPQGIAIAEMRWLAPSYRDFALDTLGTGRPEIVGVDDHRSMTTAIRMRFVEFRPASRRVSWRITLPTALAVRLRVYDVMGRLHRKLVDGILPQGESVITWDTADGNGALVRSGMYYVRLSYDGGSRVAVVPVTR